MSVTGPRVVIAGAGWRVSRFVVPALIAAGVRREEIVVVRRTDSQNLHNQPDVKVVNSLQAIGAAQPVLTLNCVLAESLVQLQRELMARFPGATHFCDTPVFHANDRAHTALRLSGRRLFSLEDWPLMPNLAFIAARARGARGSVTVRVEHFGIPLHFVAWYRTFLGSLQPFGRMLAREGDDLTAKPRTGARVVFRAPKRFLVAKVSLETIDSLAEDFHEVESSPHSDREVLYRVIDDTSVRYFLGSAMVDREDVPGALIQGFAPFDDRKNVHEMDKFVALVRIFRSALGGRSVKVYPFLSAVRDTLTIRRLEARTSSVLV